MTRPWVPSSAADKEAVREQLGRILSSTLFRNSKRFPAFLRHTVEHALVSAEPMKERTIGHEVFARDVAYDTAQDPIVRMTAAEVRKRLALYYQAPEHSNELQIAYQPGSYVPEFSLPADPFVPQSPVNEPPPARDVLPDTQPRRWTELRRLASVAALAALLVFLAWRTWNPRLNTALERFWAPILQSGAPALLCVGDRSSDIVSTSDLPPSPSELTVDQFLQSNSVRYTDAVTLALLAGELRARSRAFRVREPGATEFTDLRDGPVVLIGGFNNPWTLKLSEGLRFTLRWDGAGTYIADATRPESREWQIPGRTTLLKNLSRVYGLVTRVKDPATGNVVLTVSGLLFGTRAAGECVVDEECLRAAERLQPGDWGHRNVQIVVSTPIVGNQSGAPSVVAAHLW